MDISFLSEPVGQLALIVVMQTAVTPPLGDWTRFETLMRQEKQRLGGDLLRIRMLVISDGGAPTTEQRHVMQNEIWEGRPLKTSLLTNSLKNPIKRGVATALSWMNPAFKICVPDDLRGGLTHLDLRHELEHVWQLCARLQSDMPPLATLGRIADALSRPRLASAGAKRTG